jgi:hypothetical protein
MVGLTGTGVPLVAEMFPGVMTPVPPVNTPVRFALPPVVIEVGLAEKLVMAGAATTTTDTVVEAIAPPAPLTVSV